ncbi:MAG TPA: carbamoyltransferase N-terminal domain-containing protein [Bryobacteraceae bacterium]
MPRFREMSLLNQATHRMLIQHDPDVGHRFVPNLRARVPGEDGGYFVTTNSLGFRSDREFEREKGDLPRILMFGDSYTAGDNVSNADRYSDRLSDLLGAEVQNYGVPGSGTDQHLLMYRKFAAGVDADLVMICVQIDSFHRIQLSHRPSIDRVTGRTVLVPKPYFEWENGRIVLRQVPVPKDRPEYKEPEGHEKAGSANGKRDAKWYSRLHEVYSSIPGLDDLRHSEVFEELGSRAISELHRMTAKQPYPDIVSADTPGWKLMAAILRVFIEEAQQGGPERTANALCASTQGKARPVVIVPIPTYEFYLHGVEPLYQPLFQTLENREAGVHVFDVTTPLVGLPWKERQKLRYEIGGHFTPMANRLVAETMASEIRSRKLLPDSALCPVLMRDHKGDDAPSAPDAVYILGISCFYHNSAAALIRDGQIVAAAEEERFSRVKNDRRFPHNAINYCLEQGGISQKQLTAVVYYDNSALTFERLCQSLAAVDRESAARMWQKIMPSWLRMKLHFPKMLREYLSYDGPILQGVHHRSHAASCFFPSPFERAAILTIDGVGEWATASIGRGAGNRVELIKEMRFPHSLGLLYSAFTQFTGFKVNSGEYKMMGLAPYGEPVYEKTILDNLVDLKADGSVELNLEYFAFLRDTQTTNERFAGLFGGSKRRPETRITRREIDMAKSIQAVTEEAMLRMAREAHRLTGEKFLCIAGGVALNCVANGRLLREGPFKDVWIQPAAGDSGCALGVALDAYHSYYGHKRRFCAGRSAQGGSYLGPDFSPDEIESYLETFGYPYRKFCRAERNRYLAEKLAEGKVVGHFSGRLEFGPRSLGARSILGDPRNPDMQASLNLRIKYRESFRPFAPAVLAERVGDYFELDRESPYMLLVAPVKRERRLPLEAAIGADDDLLPVVRRLRSDIPAVTHVDYSARIQTVRREHHPEFYDLIAEFERLTGCGVIVNTSFNVRGEPIVCTPQDAYRCFMRTEMDVLALGEYILSKEEQPVWPEGKGEGLENEDAATSSNETQPEELLKALVALFECEFWPAAQKLKSAGQVRIEERFRRSPTMWEDSDEPADLRPLFELAPALLNEQPHPKEFTDALCCSWLDQKCAAALKPIIAKLVKAGLKHQAKAEIQEQVSESVYVMF